MQTITLKLDASAFADSLSELKPHLLHLGNESVELLLRSIELCDKLFIIESGVAVGATQVLLLKPSDFFSDLIAAGRAGNLERFIVEYAGAHGLNLPNVEGERDGCLAQPVPKAQDVTSNRLRSSALLGSVSFSDLVDALEYFKSIGGAMHVKVSDGTKLHDIISVGSDLKTLILYMRPGNTGYSMDLLPPKTETDNISEDLQKVADL